MNWALYSRFVPHFFSIFILSWMLVPFWSKSAIRAGLTGKDIHKSGEQRIPEMGGVIVLLTFIIGLMGYIALRVFTLNAETNITLILALLTAVLIAGIIGLIDDILGWKIGLRQWQKPLLTLLVAAPIMAVNAGTRIMHLPFVGEVNLGMAYPLLVIPFLILMGTNGFNMLAGYNGLEAGQGIIILSTLAYFSYQTHSPWLAVVALCFVFALAGFWLHNKYPAKIFPGDTLTYTTGAVIAIIAILGNLEKIFLILYVPYILEFFLKLRGRFQKESFAQIQEDGTLKPRYDKIYGLENLMVLFLNKLKIKTTERRVVWSLHLFQLLFVLLTFVL